MKKYLLTLAAFFVATSTANADVIAGFGYNVENKALSNKIETLDKTNPDAQNVIFHTEILNEQGNTITHVWKNGDQEIYRKPFNVNGQRWRVWTSMNAEHFSEGDNITVEVQDQEGKNIYVGKLGVATANIPADAPAQPQETPADLPVDNVPSTLDVE
ncbi:MAG: DUF2914 domain-containing protein [Alphaproteobacteria bacterium]